MIETLVIENLGVIAQTDLEIHEGLTALSGETGAGKTMALTSLQLLLGSKADASRVRTGSKAARVEGTFIVPSDSPVLSTIDDAGGSYDIDGSVAEVIVARHVPAHGRSSAYVGGRRVPTAVLAEIARELVTVHGQSDQIRLATPTQQRQAVDRFGGDELTVALESWGITYRAYNEAKKALDVFESSVKDRARERLALEALVAKVDDVHPERGEDEALKEEARILETSDERYTAFSTAAAQLAGADGVDYPAAAGIEAALSALNTIDAEISERLHNVRVELDDIAATLADKASRVEADPERLAEIFSRRQVLAGLRKGLGMPLDAAIDAADEAREALADLGDPDAARVRLSKELADCEAAMRRAGEKLTHLRESAARELAVAVERELRELALVNARFIIVVETAEPGPYGTDTVTFLLAPHVGAVPSPIATAASGGELSRVMLALEVSLAAREADAARTFLFDEIDAGIGGQAALAVGRRLAQLAATHQVIVVTHLAQVAAYASNHIVVVKEENDVDTRTRVVPVAGDARVDELARMLSGNITETARNHASELLSGSGVAR